MDENHRKAAPSNGGHASDRGRFQELLNFLETTDLVHVHVERGGSRLTLKRSGIAPAAQPKPAAASEGAPEEEPKSTLVFIRSPIVGRFYSSTGPDRPPLVVEGGKVTAGQRVAIVEAMKIRKEVFSAVTGRVARISVRDGEPVEYGQELFAVEPAENG